MPGEPVRFVQLGLGPIGRAVACLAASRPAMELVGAADLEPSIVGRDVGEIVGVDPLGAVVTGSLESLLDATRPELALHSTGSFLDRVAPQIRACLERGVSVVSTCEELSYPFYRHPRLAEELDAMARAHGAVLLGTGINPGFVLDKLIATMTTACTRVDRVVATRVLDAGTRRRPFVEKIGAGITVEEFERRASGGGMGHLGLAESMHLVADVMGVAADREYSETVRPKVAESDVATDVVSVERGRVLGVEQVAVLEAEGRERVRMELQLWVGADRPRDEFVIEGLPALHVVVSDGVPGDEGTAAATVNYALRVRELSPGLRTVLDVPVRFDAGAQSVD